MTLLEQRWPYITGLCLCILYQATFVLIMCLVPVTGYIFPRTKGIDFEVFFLLLFVDVVSVVIGILAALILKRSLLIIPQILLVITTIWGMISFQQL